VGQRGTRTARWVVISVGLLVLVWALYRLFDSLVRFSPDTDLNRLLLPVLTLTLVVLALALAGVLIRNLVRLIVDRKRGMLGARLRTKLVFFLLALVLVPSLFLFYGSATIIKQTVDAVLRVPLEDLTRQTTEIVNQWNDYFQGQSLRRAEALAEEIQRGNYLDRASRSRLERLIQPDSSDDDPVFVWVRESQRIVARSGDLDAERAEHQPVLEELAAALSQRVAGSGQAESRIDHLGDGLLVHAAVPLPTSADRSVVVSVGLVLPTRVAENLADIVRAEQNYRQFRVERRKLFRLYLTLIGLVFLVTLFVATWIGFYLTRRITVPIQELAAASREISAGNLDVRVRAQVGDELGMLVDSFNEMAGELQESREVITRSTSDLRRSYRTLEERRRYIETLLANLSTAVISLDPAGRVTTVNPAAREILGVELVVGAQARQVFEERGLNALSELLDPRFRMPDQELRRDLSIDGNPGTVSVSVQISPLTVGDAEALGTLVMVEDLTELLRAQRAAAWREVARRIAHEIKNPLTPIQLAAQRLRKKFAEGADDLHRVVPEATASIEHEVGALKRLVDEFSKFARMPEVAPDWVDLPAMIDSALRLYEAQPDVVFSVDVDERLGRVRLDPEQMRRVLINLIDNSLTAMEQRGSIRIDARRVGEDVLRIEFSDSGPGIPPGDRDKMFSPYFSTKKRGTGLGLAIVHKVVTDHHGTIRVEPNEPQGARFVIEIPA